MGFDNKYPYTDFHEMNEDWFLLHFKEVMEAVHQNNETVKGLIEYIHSLGLVVIDDNAPALDKVYSSKHTQDLLDDKVDKVAGMGLSQNNFTNALKNKLDGIEAGANKTVVDDYIASLQTNPVEGGVIYQALNSKVDKVAGKQLSQENYTSTEKTKLADIAENATKTEIDDTFNSGLKIGTISINDVDTDLNVPVDDELSNTSTNPMQNKAIYDLVEEILPEVTATGNPISINDAFGFPANSCEVTFSPSNGRSSLFLKQAGKNILAKPFVYDNNIDYTINNYFFVKAGSYRFSFNMETTNWRTVLRMKDKDGNDLSSSEYQPSNLLSWSSTRHGWMNGSNGTVDTYYLTIVTDCYIRLLFASGSTSASTVVSNAQLELGTSRTVYEAPVTPITHNATFPSTTQGGIWYVTEGKIILDDQEEITLTPEEIELLKGNNTICSDADGDINLVYAADIKKWVLNQ